jgi:hypothetical protein
MSYPQQYPGQPQQGYAPPAQQFAQPQAYADPNAGQQYPGQPQQGYAPPANQNPYAAAQQQGYIPAGQASTEVEDTSGMFGGAPSISWDVDKGYVLGTPRGGQVVAKQVNQQTDQKSKQLKFFQGSNQPMMQIVVTVQTRERTDANDDGKRVIYVKGLMMKSAKKAFEAHGAKDIEIGSYFYAANTSKTAGPSGKANDFDCVYARPGQPDPLAHLPAYVAPQLAPPAQPPTQFVAPQQPNYPQPGQQPAWNPYGPPQGAPAGPPPQQYAQPAAPQQDPNAQGNAYGYGHNPAQSPGGQAYAAAQQPPQAQPDPNAQYAPQPGAPAGPPAGYSPF